MVVIGDRTTRHGRRNPFRRHGLRAFACERELPEAMDLAVANSLHGARQQSNAMNPPPRREPQNQRLTNHSFTFRVRLYLDAKSLAPSKTPIVAPDLACIAFPTLAP